VATVGCSLPAEEILIELSFQYHIISDYKFLLETNLSSKSVSRILTWVGCREFG